MKINKYIEVEVPNEEEYETCVVCHKLTKVKKNTDIDIRSHYVEGVGQLCKRCFKELYQKDKKSKGDHYYE